MIPTRRVKCTVILVPTPGAPCRRATVRATGLTSHADSGVSSILMAMTTPSVIVGGGYISVVHVAAKAIGGDAWNRPLHGG
jgi:hypothetical protein